jgi:hypothetical protein
MAFAFFLQPWYLESSVQGRYHFLCISQYQRIEKRVTACPCAEPYTFQEVLDGHFPYSGADSWRRTLS